MYRCDECQASDELKVPRGQKLLKRVIYKTVKHREGTIGRQIAKEIKLCRKCMAKTSNQIQSEK